MIFMDILILTINQTHHTLALNCHDLVKMETYRKQQDFMELKQIDRGICKVDR